MMERQSKNLRTSLPTLIAAVLMLLTGCATILEGPRQTIRLHCEPSDGLKVIVDGKETEFVNGDIHLDKKRVTHFVTFEKERYYPSTISFNREINPFWVVADLIWGPAVPIAWIVDWQTGSFYRIDPRDLHIALRQQD